MKCPECNGTLIQMVELDLWLCEECPYAETQALHNRRAIDEDNTELGTEAPGPTEDVPALLTTEDVRAQMDQIAVAHQFEYRVQPEGNTTAVITNIE